MNFLLIYAAMKLSSWQSYPKLTRGHFLHFLVSVPYLSLHPKKRPYEHAPIILVVKFVLALSSFLFFCLFVQKFMLPLNYWKMVFISPLVYLLTESLGTFGQLLYISKKIPPFHYHPLRSRSLGEFWGKRWNVWVQDWLRDVSGGRRRALHHNMAITFLISGFFHEIMFNLAYSIYTKTFFFGNMFLYFSIQGVGLYVEKRWLKGQSELLKTVYLWTVVVLPSPIFLSNSFLLFFGLIHG